MTLPTATAHLLQSARHRTVLTKAEWQDVVRLALASQSPYDGAPAVAVDTETYDCGYPDIDITGFSIAWCPDGKDWQGAYIPLKHNTGELTLGWLDVYEGLRAICDGSRELIFQNAKYDKKAFAAQTPPLHIAETIFDTMIASWMLNTNGVGTKAQVQEGHGSHGLKALSKYILDYEMTELTSLAKEQKVTLPNGTVRKVLRVDLVPVADLAPYAADDVIQTARLRDVFKPRLAADPKVNRFFELIAMEFVFVLADMEEFGIELDVKVLDEMRGRAQKEIKETTKALYDARSEEDCPAPDAAGIALIAQLVQQYDALDARFTLPPTDIRYPRNAKGKPTGKGHARKELFAKYSGVHPVVVDKVRDDKLRSDVGDFPELAHKIFAVGSNNTLNEVLFNQEYLEPIGGIGLNGLYSTKAENVDEWAEGGSAMAVALLRHRELTKLNGTYLVGMRNQLSMDGRLRTRFSPIGARTGRVSSSTPNLQNVPTSKEFPIRQAFVGSGVSDSTVSRSLDPNTGTTTVRVEKNDYSGWYETINGRVVAWDGPNPPWVLSVGDYSMLELRLLAHVSNDAVLIGAIQNGVDLHALTARAVFDEIPDDLPLDEVKKQFPELRSAAKPIGFGVIYGMGPQKLARELSITEEEAQEMIDVRYMQMYPGVKIWIDKEHDHVKLTGYAKTATGRKRHLPAAQLNPKGAGHFRLIKQAERQAQNFPVQGLAADVITIAMRDIRRMLKTTTVADLGVGVVLDASLMFDFPTVPLYGDYARPLLQVHDELVQEMHPAVANAVLDATTHIMETALSLRVPLKVDAALGPDWASTKK